MDRRASGHVLIVGGTGRLGGLLRRAFAAGGAAGGGAGLVWQRRGTDRGAPGDPVFDPLHDPAAYADAARGASVILNLAGRVGGDAAALADHARLATAAFAAARAAGVPRLLQASSAAVYGAASPGREDDAPSPLAPYGAAKAEVERALLAAACGEGPAVTLLRIGNVAGADQLLGAPRGAVPQMLDVFADGTAPRRSYIGPVALAGVLGRLVTAPALPPVLNIALDGAVGMDALLDAAGRLWVPRPAPAGLIPEVRLDVARLAALLGGLGSAEAGAIAADLRSLDGAAP